MKLSIVIPCRNEAKYIVACLQSIVNNNIDKNNLSVWVCDGLSTDNTVEIINEFALKYNFIHCIENTKKTTPFALNLGITKSLDSDFIMILGAHSELSENYLIDVLKTFELHPEAFCVGGFINNIYENNKALFIGKAMSSLFGVGNAHFRLGTKNGWVDTVAFGTYRREVFTLIGFFDEDLARNQDDEFSYRMQKNNLKIYLNSKCIINYYVRSSFIKLFKQYYQYGLWKVYVNNKHKAVTSIRQTIPFILVSYTILSIIIPFFLPKILNIVIFLLLIYFTIAFLVACFNGNNLKEKFGIFWSYLLLHYGYGLGYLIGIIKFLILRLKPNKNDEILTR
ncbi:MAG: glycosyltransferase family 2 protein [Bacteroidales bacterium]